VIGALSSRIDWLRAGLLPTTRRLKIGVAGWIASGLAIVGSVGLGIRIMAPGHANISWALIAAVAGGAVSLRRWHSRYHRASE
jgi:hypothetical protein